MIYGWDPADPQKLRAYHAQSSVMLHHPEHDLKDLRAVQRYVDQLRAAENIAVGGPFRAWLFEDGGDQLIIDRPRKLGDAAGKRVYVAALGTKVRILPWADRASHYEEPEQYPGYGEITVGGPPGSPLSHRLLIVHEFAHVGRHKEMHGPVWAAAFLQMTQHHLQELRDELFAAFTVHGVQAV